MTPITKKALQRRTFLRGLGATVALPFLDAMTPALTAATSAPLRVAWFYVPNGIDMRNWVIPDPGPLTKLPPILQPLDSLKSEVLMLSNLTANWGRPLLVGAGDHGRALAAYMTGSFVHQSVSNLKLGVSADQIIANAIGQQTRLPSLEIGLEETRQAGNCDNGYSCSYAYNIAWKTATQPLPPVSEPRILFERLFGTDVFTSPEDRARRLGMRRSILDSVMESTKKVQASVGPVDRRKLDEYLSSVRQVEQQVERAEKDGKVIVPGIEKPFGVPADFGDYFKLMTDMLFIAFQADLTRVATVMIGREGSNRPYPEIGIPDSHHPITHHQKNPVLLDKISAINTYHVKLFAAFLHRLLETKEGDSNLLNNSMICYGSGLSDGDTHLHDELPTILAGRGGNFFTPGRHIIYQRETPVTNLFATMAQRTGVRADHVGDSTGQLVDLSLS
ncbi:MAG TPA: DUF1552 domain-containing protein [Bryobacteraceae bacterium]|nr:DUF1552 domain-containing protein [Bryobacteraceae bacterium]